MKRRNAPQAPFKSDGNKLGKARFGAGLSREPRMPRGHRHDGPGDLRKRTVNARRVTRKRPMNKFETTTLYEENKPGPTMHERSSSTTHAGLDICRLLQVPGRALSLTSARCACIKTRGVLDPRRLCLVMHSYCSLWMRQVCCLDCHMRKRRKEESMTGRRS